MNQEQIHFAPAQRIATFKPYFFASRYQRILELKAKNIDVIRIDIGSPDLPPDDSIIEALVEAARLPDTHGYTPDGGSPAFRQTIANYYLRRFGVEINSNTEAITLLGSKEGLFNLTQVLVNPGDIVLVPNPGYPVYQASALIAGAQVYPVPLLRENNYLPDLKTIPHWIVDRAKILWLNYPNNPTGAIAPFSFFEEVIQFARENKLLVAHDAPYTDVCFDGYVAPSILQVPGAKEVAVEFNSLSKTYNMAGWRLGMAVGNPEVIRYLRTYKSQMDSSHFEAVLRGGIAALSGDQEWISERNQVYQERRDIVLSGLRTAGFSVETPPAAIYVWAKLPMSMTDSMAFCDKLLDETGVSTTPGVVYGNYGEGYLRISLGARTDRLREAMDRMVDWLRVNEEK